MFWSVNLPRVYKYNIMFFGICCAYYTYDNVQQVYSDKSGEKCCHTAKSHVDLWLIILLLFPVKSFYRRHSKTFTPLVK